MVIINKVQLTGNLGGSPEIRNFDNGNKMARFSMSTREEFTTRKGEKGTDVQWHYVIGWGKVAEKMETELQKGSYVSIEGRLITRNYTDKTGVKRYFTEVIAAAVIPYKKAV